MARLLRHGLRKDGRTLRFMPAQDIAWLPERDVIALISYWRSVPPVRKPNGPIALGILAKVLDRRDEVVIDVARRIDHSKFRVPEAPAPTAEYGALLALSCKGCHGDQLSGGRIPGTPASFPVPSNLTPHVTGLRDWTYGDFERLLATGVKKNGKRLDPFMPLESVSKLDTTERRALWAHLRALPPTPFGER
jgi:hypothetical protein